MFWGVLLAITAWCFLTMTAERALSITGFGLSSAFGPTWAAAQAGIEVQKRVFRKNSGYFDQAFNPVLCAFAEPEFATIEARLPVLAHQALADSLNTMPDNPPAVVTIGAVVPEADPLLGLTEDRLGIAVEAMQDAVTETLDAAGVAVEEWFVGPLGHAGVGQAVHAVRDIESPAHLILAVDSFCDRARIAAAVDAGLIHSDKSPWGFVPGEAAGALWLLREADTLPPRVLNTGSAFEPVGERSEEESDYSALSEAVRDAFSGAGEGKAAQWYADMNNDRYRASEASYALHRASAFWLEDDVELVQPAVSFGDCGAASGMCAMALALGSKTTSVISGSSTGGLRSVMVVGV